MKFIVISVQKAGKLMLQNCNFTNNKAKLYAGSMHISEVGYFHMENIKFEDNYSRLAGAVQIKNSQIVFIKDTIFINNRANNFAGALFIDLVANTTLINV